MITFPVVSGGGGAWNLIVDQAVNTDRILIEGLAGDTDRIYKFILEGTKAGDMPMVLCPNSDEGQNYEYSQHEAGYFAAHNTIHGVACGQNYSGLKIFHNMGRGVFDVANFTIRGMLHAVDTGRARQCLTEVALWWSNDGMACRQDLWAVWLNTADEITSLYFKFFSNLTGHLYIFTLA